MSPSPDLIAFIARWEGCRLEAYQDAVGVWTVGYGTTRGVKAGDCISQERAEELLRDEVAEKWAELDEFVHVTLAQHEMDAITSLAYNVGVSAVSKSTLLSRLNGGDFGSAADEFLRWNRAGGRILPGLTKRRRAERAMFLDADYSGAP